MSFPLLSNGGRMKYIQDQRFGYNLTGFKDQREMLCLSCRDEHLARTRWSMALLWVNVDYTHISLPTKLKYVPVKVDSHFLFFFNLFFYLRIILYRIFLFSVKLQHASAIGVHISLPFWTSFSSAAPSHPLGWYLAPVWVSWAIQQILVAIYLTCGNVSFHITIFIHLTLSSLLPMSISLFSMSVSPLLPCK